MTNVLYSLTLISAFALAGLVWKAWFVNRWSQSSLRGVRLSWIFLLLYMISSVGALQVRDDLTALMAEGLSTGNKFQVGVTALGLIWALILLFSRRVTLSALFAGPGFWISCLILLYGLSSFWSVWPALSAYRTLELAVMWVITVHIFSGERCVGRIDQFLLWTLAIYWISRLARFDPNLLSNTQVFGLIRENTGGAMAAIVLLWTINRGKSNGWRRNAVRLAVAIVSLVIFGSLASALACGAALIVLEMSFRAGFRFKTAAFCAIAGVAMVYGVLVMQSEVPSLSPALINSLGTVSGKTAETILTLDGRIPLWTAIWDATKDKPWGSGYAAAERTFEADAKSISWAPGNAHSGYVSGWFGAGWAGVIAVLLVFWAMWGRRRRLPFELQPLVTALLILLAINNASIPGIGGRSNPVFIFMMALACMPPALERRFPKEAKI
jgi:hypothetical protein